MKSFAIQTGWRIALAGAVFLLFASGARAEEKLSVHEWGTFTSLQNEQGETIGGINTDDEPVPEFVHRLAQFVLLRPTEIPSIFFQGAPRCHPDVTMRLETPVIYFHPPTSETNIQMADVHVKFRGGWLTEFYPDAKPDTAGLKDGRFQFPHLLSSSEGKLEWKKLEIGGHWPLTNTSEHVWTSPRNVQAATVRAVNGESEKFLFYRGVGHIDAPLRISRDEHSGELLFRSQLQDLPNDKPLAIRSIWMVNIQRNGQLAFRSLPSITLDSNSKKILTHTPAEFRPNDFSLDNLEDLKASLQAALVSEGLFLDEAQALLNTWELSYFKSPGVRVFFIVPRVWSDFYLPLEISKPCEINRVMVGRVELITTEQRLALRKLANYSVHEMTNEVVQLTSNFYASAAKGGAEWEELSLGKKPLAASISVPKTYQTYLDLGRFRNALILDEAKRSPSEGLTSFISTYRLAGFKLTDPEIDSEK